ncbi:unnamed protein product, partial [Staurois parvus]
KAELHPKGEVLLSRLVPRSPLRIGTFGGRGRERLPEFDKYLFPLLLRSPRLSEVEGVLPPPSRSLFGHVTGPRRLQDHSGSAALLMHAQWVPGCEAASCHIRVPTLKMAVPNERRRVVKLTAEDTPRDR